MSHKPPHISKWSIGALLVALAGAAITIGIGQVYIKHWADTGVKFSPVHGNEVELPAGRSLVYYESTVGVPASDVLRMFGPDGETYFPSRPRVEQEYHSYLSGISGRALWELDLSIAGMYRFDAYKSSFLSDADIPPDDRIVFMKSPNSLTEVRGVQTAIQVTGASATLAIVAMLYLIHIRGLKQYNASVSAAQDSESDPDGLEDDLFVNPVEA